MNTSIQQFVDWINEATHITVFTGAGISTASGIPDFRSANGIWKDGGNREYYLSKGYYELNPEDFWSKYKDIFQIKLMDNYLPNEGHLFLKELEGLSKNVTVLTQNVDNLHRDAGSSHVIELHGTIKTATCQICRTQYGLDYINNNDDVPRCNRVNYNGDTCGLILKPDVVLFGDNVIGYEQAEEAIDRSTLFIVLGSSLEVYPVNNMPEYANFKGHTKMVIINQEATMKDRMFDLVFHEPINKIVRELKDKLSI